ncbi:hypothetical protein [Paractinoplanes durhamensis]|uniref:hypothetical protein n=1 Tax=Paractinoplanes durhamensis TaxID=113563 RepID=UPI0036409AB1
MRTRVILSATTLAAAAGLIATVPATAAPAARPTTPAQATAFAQTAVKDRAALFAASTSDAFAARGTKLDATGISHVHMDRTYHGLQVIGGDVIAHLNADGSVREVTRTLLAPSPSA